MTQSMLSGIDGVTVHFARLRVTEISLSKKALSQFDFAPIIDGARMLADAQVHAIAWNGTSGGWLGLDVDRELCGRIEQETGIPATTSSLALVEILQRTGARSLGWATPYIDDIQERIMATFNAVGFSCRAERHLGDLGNFSFSEIGEDRIEAMVREVASQKPDAAVIYCTNLRGARLVDRLERDLDLPIYDSVATAVWKSLALAGVDPRLVRGWGRLFSIPSIEDHKV